MNMGSRRTQVRDTAPWVGSYVALVGVARAVGSRHVGCHHVTA
jgi:hypothetical protein